MMVGMRSLAIHLLWWFDCKVVRHRSFILCEFIADSKWWPGVGVCKCKRCRAMAHGQNAPIDRDLTVN